LSENGRQLIRDEDSESQLLEQRIDGTIKKLRKIDSDLSDIVETRTPLPHKNINIKIQ